MSQKWLKSSDTHGWKVHGNLSWSYCLWRSMRLFLLSRKLREWTPANSIDACWRWKNKIFSSDSLFIHFGNRREGVVLLLVGSLLHSPPVNEPTFTDIEKNNKIWSVNCGKWKAAIVTQAQPAINHLTQLSPKLFSKFGSCVQHATNRLHYFLLPEANMTNDSIL